MIPGDACGGRRCNPALVLGCYVVLALVASAEYTPSAPCELGHHLRTPSTGGVVLGLGRVPMRMNPRLVSSTVEAVLFNGHTN